MKKRKEKNVFEKTALCLCFYPTISPAENHEQSVTKKKTNCQEMFFFVSRKFFGGNTALFVNFALFSFCFTEKITLLSGKFDTCFLSDFVVY